MSAENAPQPTPNSTADLVAQQERDVLEFMQMNPTDVTFWPDFDELILTSLLEAEKEEAL